MQSESHTYLYDYQLETKKKVMDDFSIARSVMCQLPTGTGKTHVLASIVEDFSVSGPVWIVAHRRELVDQIRATIDRRLGKDARTMATVYSVQWLSRHINERREEPSLIVIDEAHHALADTYQALLGKYPQAKVLGLTATPYRLNGKGFTDLFDRLEVSWPIKEFIRKKRLSLFDYYSIKAGSAMSALISTLNKRGADGDYQIKQLDQAINTQEVVESLYASLARLIPGKKGIVYAVNISHARKIADYYNSKGLKSMAIDSKMPTNDRNKAVEAFREGKYDVLVNVDIFSEGFDCPEVEFIQLARPTLSLSKYLQQIGRGLRPARGKEYCTIIDNVGLSLTFGSPIQDWDWEGMFKGKAGCKPRSTKSSKLSLPSSQTVSAKMTANGIYDDLELIISHSHLDRDLTENPAIKAYYDEKSRTYGLMSGDKIIVKPKIKKVQQIRHGYAVALYETGAICIVNSRGEVLPLPKGAKDVMIHDSELAECTSGARKEYYDLRNFRCYHEKPEAVEICGIKLIKAGNNYYSRSNPRITLRNPFSIDGNCYVAEINNPADLDFPIVGEKDIHTRIGYACFLKDEPYSAYAICYAFPSGERIMTDCNNNYYLLHSDGRKELLFTAPKTQAEKELTFRMRNVKCC